MGDRRKCQTYTASPAEPGELASGDLCSCSLASPHIRSDRHGPVPTFPPCLRRGSYEDETHLRNSLFVGALGWATVIIHPALTAADAPRR
jgi:hypothetical protein